MESDDPAAAGAEPAAEPTRPRRDARESAAAAVGALYQASALGLIRLAYVLLGDRPAAEDVVQDAFCGLYRHWARLENADSAKYYVRASVLNGCRSVLRRRAVRHRGLADPALAVSAEAVLLSAEERDEVIRAVGRLPHRQRELIVLRYYSDLSDDEIARVMGIRQSTVRSTAHRALEALGRAMKETS